MSTHRRSSTRARLTLLAVGVLVVVGALVAGLWPSPLTPVADPSVTSVQQECQTALGYPARTAEDVEFLSRCVHALEFRDPTPSGSPSATASPSATPTPISTPTATPTPSATPTATPTPRPTPSATPTPQPPPAGWPTPDTTGVVPGTALTPWSGSCTFTKANVVVENKTLNCQVDVWATGVVFRNSRITGGGNYGVEVHPSGSALLDHVTIQPASGCNLEGALGGGNIVATHLKVLNWGDGLFVSGPNVLMQDSYEAMCSSGSAHSDGVQGYHAGLNVVIRHNTIDQSCPPACEATAPIFWADDSVPGGLLFEGNLVIGGSYSIRVHTASNTVRDNVVARNRWIYGPVSSRCQSTTWINNRLADVSPTYATSNFAPLACSGNA